MSELNKNNSDDDIKNIINDSFKNIMDVALKKLRDRNIEDTDELITQFSYAMDLMIDHLAKKATNKMKNREDISSSELNEALQIVKDKYYELLHSKINELKNKNEIV